MSTEITYLTNGNSTFLERNKSYVSEFCEPVRPRRSETKSDDDLNAPIEHESNMPNAPTTNASPSDPHELYASANETSSRRSTRLSFQDKLDACDAHKYVETNK